MGMSEINVWVLIRRYDKFDSGSDSFETNLQCFNVLPGLTLDELKQYVHFRIGIPNDGTKVLKIRQHNNNLIPLSELLQGSQREKPFIIDVVGVHQFCPVEKRKVPPGYVDALKAKLNHLEKRVMIAETHVPNMIPIHVHSVEMTALKLANCVSFLDRRLDELAPKQWKTQMEPDVHDKD